MADDLKEALDRARTSRARRTFTDSDDVNTMLRRAAFGDPTPPSEPETPRSGGSADGGKGAPTPAPVDMNTLIRRASRRGY